MFLISSFKLYFKILSIKILVFSETPIIILLHLFFINKLIQYTIKGHCSFLVGNINFGILNNLDAVPAQGNIPNIYNY